MLKKVINNLLGQKTERHEAYRDKYYRFRHAASLLNDNFPFLSEVMRWVEDTNDFNDLQLKERCLAKVKYKPSLDVYDLVSLNDFFRSHLVATDVIKSTSRKQILFMDRNALDLFFGRKTTVNTVTLTVVDENLIAPLQVVVADFQLRQARRKKTDRVEINCQLLTSLDDYTVIKADLFGNIPSIIKEGYANV